MSQPFSSPLRRWLRRGLIVAAALAVIGGALVSWGLVQAERKLQRRIEAPLHRVAVPEDAAGFERGRYLFASRGCATCHGSSGAGKDFVNDGQGLRIHAPNITPGSGSAVLGYRSEDWVRTVRHGVKPDGRPLFVMPSEDYNRFTDADIGALVAYLQRLPAQAGAGFSAELPLVVRLAYGFGVLQDAAAKIDHRLPPQQPVPEAASVEHGQYVANMCIGCHGAQLSGGKIPGAPPGWPAAANLTPGSGSVMPRYPDAAAFVAMMRTGLRPDGSGGIREMPFSSFRQMSEVDLQALYVFLRSLPARPGGER
jgi:mono/diheme cytochrome c family protein